MKTVLLATLALAPLAAALPAAAQTDNAAPAGSRVSDPHRSDDIIVTAPLRQSEADVLQGTSVLTGEDLTRQLRPTIGETLARLPGVSASSFGPNASRPILRGFQGDRIRVLTDGIGSIDVSNTSVDHAVIIDPLLAERVEVLRGPAALLYGSSAVGGVVNVVDTRIPRRLPENGYRLDAIGTYGSAANERSLGGAADATVAGPLVLHVDGSYSKSDDLRTGGYILSREARRASLASAALPADPDDPIDFAGNAALRGKLPNTAAETWTAGAGASIVTDGGMLGVSYGHYDSLYGLPIRYATASGQEQEAPRLDVLQNRYDLRAEITPQGSVIQAIRLRAAHANYRHFELEEDGSVGTAFYNKGLEGRLEVVQAKRGGWQGASGAQYFSRAFNVVGDEAFLPRNNTEQTGLFTLQQYDGASAIQLSSSTAASIRRSICVSCAISAREKRAKMRRSSSSALGATCSYSARPAALSFRWCERRSAALGLRSRRPRSDKAMAARLTVTLSIRVRSPMSAWVIGSASAITAISRHSGIERPNSEA